LQLGPQRLARQEDASLRIVDQPTAGVVCQLPCQRETRFPASDSLPLLGDLTSLFRLTPPTFRIPQPAFGRGLGDPRDVRLLLLLACQAALPRGQCFGQAFSPLGPLPLTLRLGEFGRHQAVSGDGEEANRHHQSAGGRQ
jgi:hypothetical protein